MYGNGKIILGKGSYIGRYSSIQSTEGCTVRIGEKCSISHYCMIYTKNLKANQDFSKSRIVRKGDVFIGNNCWIGARVFICEGVSIGDNVVVGAGSVVTRDIPSFVVVAGCPAIIIKRINH